MRRASSVFLASLLFSLLSTLAACSAGSIAPPSVEPPAELAPETSSSQPATPTVAPVPTPTPVVSQIPQGNPGGTLTLVSTANIPHRDVHQVRQETLATLGPGLAYSRLLRLRTGPLVEQPSLMLECDLCESWRVAQDLSYEFQLRPDVHWQNLEPVSGRPLVAEDLVFSYQRMETPDWPHAQMFSNRGISRFEAPQPDRLRVERAFLDSDALLALADGYSKIIAPEVVEQYGDLKQSPVVGTGPWIWQENGREDGWEFIRNSDYFEKDLPYLDGLNVRLISDYSTAGGTNSSGIAAFQAGQVDVLNLEPAGWNSLSSSTAEFNARLDRQSQPGLVVWTNLQGPLGSQPVLRRAIFKAIDPWEYVHDLWYQQGAVSAGVPVLNPQWLLSRDVLRDDYFASPIEARELVESLHDMQPLTLRVAISDASPAHAELGKKIISDLRTVGIDADIRAVHPAHYTQMLLGDREDFDLIIGSAPPVNTANGFLLGLLHSEGPGNILGHQDAVLDRMIVEQASEEDPEVRRTQILELQQYLLDQAYLFSPVNRASHWAFRWDLQGFHPNSALSENIFWSRAWLE